MRLPAYWGFKIRPGELITCNDNRKNEWQRAMWILFLYPFSPAKPPLFLPVCPSPCVPLLWTSALRDTKWDCRRRPVQRGLLFAGRENELKINSRAGRTSELEIGLKALSKAQPRQQKKVTTTYPFNIVRSAPRALRPQLPLMAERVSVSFPHDGRRIQNRCASPPTCSHFIPPRWPFGLRAINTLHRSNIWVWELSSLLLV